jgi:anti-anti-sigma factor
MSMSVTVDDGRAAVFVFGEVDMASAPVLRVALRDALARTRRDDVDGPIVIDLSHLTFMDARGLGVLADAARRARMRGGEIVLRDPNRLLLRALHVTGLSDVRRVERLASRVASPVGRG